MMSIPTEAPSISAAPAVTRIAWALLAIYVFVLPIGHTTALRNLLFFSLSMITLWLAWRGKLRISIPILKPWLLYAAVAFISLAYAIDPLYSLGEIKTEIGYGFLAMLLGATWINTADRLSHLVWIFIASNAFLVAGSLYHALPMLPHPQNIVVGGFNIGVGKLSTYIILMSPFIVAAWFQLSHQHAILKTLLPVLIAGNIAALYFTGNRAGMVTLIIEIVVGIIIALKYRPALRWGWKTVAILAVAVLLIGTLVAKQVVNRAPDQSNVNASVTKDGRWDIWRLSLQNLETHPLSGGGYGMFAFKLANPDFAKNNPQMWHAHNTLLNVGVQTGLPGIAAFIILIIAALLRISAPLREMYKWNATRIYSLAAVVMFAGFAVKLQTDDFFGRDIALFFWLIVGALSSNTASSRR